MPQKIKMALGRIGGIESIEGIKFILRIIGDNSIEKEVLIKKITDNNMQDVNIKKTFRVGDVFK